MNQLTRAKSVVTQQRKTTRGAAINPTEGCEKVVALCGLLLRVILKEDIQDSQQRFSVIKPRKKTTTTKHTDKHVGSKREESVTDHLFQALPLADSFKAQWTSFQ